MISVSEQKSHFSEVNKKLRIKSLLLIEQLKEQHVEIQELIKVDIESNGFDSEKIYFVIHGSVSVLYDEKIIFHYEESDIFLPYSNAIQEQSGLEYKAKDDVKFLVISLTHFYQAMADNLSLMSLWVSLNHLNELQLKQIIGVLTKKEKRANPGFARYKAGMEIIKEGDDADYVYSVSEGTAVALHNGVEVGEIGQDEIFGAIAVLTGQKRTASVVAKTKCTILMVHKNEFTEMVQSHPRLFLNILTSLAQKLTSLNEKVSALL